MPPKGAWRLKTSSKPPLVTAKKQRADKKAGVQSAATIADIFNVDVATLSRWKVEHPEFSESMSRGKEMADATIADNAGNPTCTTTRRGAGSR